MTQQLFTIVNCHQICASKYPSYAVNVKLQYHNTPGSSGEKAALTWRTRTRGTVCFQLEVKDDSHDHGPGPQERYEQRHKDSSYQSGSPEVSGVILT
jgi:hypothetical protein